MELVIITGQSGAGKSTAIACLEDIGYYCVDNLPPAMISDLVKHLRKDASIEKIAVVTDVRGRRFFSDLDRSLQALEKEKINYRILFLEASEKTILMRYQETRREHPLADDGDTEAAILAEAEMLEDIRTKADSVINTTGMKTANLYSEIMKILGADGQEQFRVSVISFGFKYGMPDEADWIIDARFLPNPYYVESLKRLTGRNKKVRDFVLGFSETREFIDKMTATFLDLIPRYRKEGKYHLDIAVGCTGGKHRSVVIAAEIAKKLRENGYNVELSNRELRKNR